MFGSSTLAVRDTRPTLEELLGRGTRKGSILIVDDNRDCLELLCAVLRQEGYRVHAAGDGVQCLRLAKTLRPDLILLNYVMPVMDGLTALHLLKKDPVISYLKVVMFSALGNTAWLQEASASAGALGCLNTPFDLKTLRNAVERALRA